MRRTGSCQAPLLADPAVLTERLAQLSSPAALTVGLLSRRHLATPPARPATGPPAPPAQRNTA